MIGYETTLPKGWVKIPPAVGSSQPGYVHFGWRIQWAADAPVYSSPSGGEPAGSLRQGSEITVYLVEGKPGWFKYIDPDPAHTGEFFVYIPSYAGAEKII